MRPPLPAVGQLLGKFVEIGIRVDVGPKGERLVGVPRNIASARLASGSSCSTLWPNAGSRYLIRQASLSDRHVTLTPCSDL